MPEPLALPTPLTDFLSKLRLDPLQARGGLTLQPLAPRVAAALAEDGEAEGHSLEPWLGRTGEFVPGRRLDVCANAYFARNRNCLNEDYGALATALGEEAFHDLVMAYLPVHPPNHPSLRFAGEALARIPAERWPGIPLRPQPGTQRLRLAGPVHELQRAGERGLPLPRVPEPRATAVCDLPPSSGTRAGPSTYSKTSVRLDQKSRSAICVTTMASVTCDLRWEIDPEAGRMIEGPASPPRCTR